MLTRSLSNNIHNQIKGIVDDLINKVVTRKKVTWAPKGITEARTFEIEPWRRIRPTPPTMVRCADKGTEDEPFTLPVAHMMKPLADYSDYVSPSFVIRSKATSAKATSAKATSAKATSAKVLPSMDLILMCDLDDDDDDDKKPGPSAPPLLPRSQTVSLAEVYAIIENMKKVKNLDKFINNSVQV